MIRKKRYVKYLGIHKMLEEGSLAKQVGVSFNCIRELTLTEVVVLFYLNCCYSNASISRLPG